MKSRWFLLVKAVISILVAIAMLLLPATFGGWFGLSTNPATVAMARLLGASMVGIALICYFASGATASALRRKTILSLCVADTIGFIVQLAAQISGVFGALGWILVVIWALLALGLAYFYFLKPQD
jgi:hypothetical protein